MPINNITQTVSTIPAPPHRGVDVQTVFVNKQEDFQDHLQGTTVTELNTLKTQINTTVTGMNIAVETINTKASEASTSASSASTSANTATTKASEASTSASNANVYSLKAGKWADNNYNVEVEAGKYSAKHWATEASNIVSSVISNVFNKPSKGALFTKISPSSISIPRGFEVEVNGVVFCIDNDYTLTLASNLVGSTKTAGTDYYVYAKTDGSFYISASDSITTDRLIGGFHYGLVGETELLTGNKTEADMIKIRGINEYSFWDLKYRPVASPKGMVNIGKKWYDIYLLNSEHITNGTSKAGVTIAAGATEYGRAIPKIPLEFGGNNTLTYGKFTWFQACEIAKAASKQLLNYSEFPTIAYGVTEQVSSLTNTYETVMGKIEHYPNLTSKYGIEQATGTQWIWGNDLANGHGTTDFAWKTGLTASRGNIYSTSNSPVAVILGGNRDDGVNAGSRASSWYNYVWYSDWYIGCRFACDHLELE